MNIGTVRFIVTMANLVVWVVIIGLLGGCAPVLRAGAWYVAHTQPLPCEPGVCTWSEMDAERDAELIPVDLGPRRDSAKVTVEP